MSESEEDQNVSSGSSSEEEEEQNFEQDDQIDDNPAKAEDIRQAVFRTMRKRPAILPKKQVNNDSLPWIEKYRPKSMEEVISHDNKIKVLRSMIDKRALPHMLLYGSPGTGKTSLILALARDMYGENWRRYVLELNASDDRGIEIVRKNIPLFAKSRADDMRLIILDEADAMTADAQSALRRIMELYIRTCRFCLICNNVNKIIPGVQSRCAKMRFGVLDQGSIRDKLHKIIGEEGIKIEEKALDKLLENFQDFRQILNMLQCLRSIRLGETITANDVKEYLGKADKETILEVIKMLETQPFKKCYNFLMSLHWENKINLTDLIQNMVGYLVDHETMDEEKRSLLLDGLASVEYRIVTGSDTEVQLASLVGVWLQAR